MVFDTFWVIWEGEISNYKVCINFEKFKENNLLF